MLVQYNTLIREIRANRGSEFTNIVINCSVYYRIYYTTSTLYQPNQNSVAERKHQTLWNTVHCIKQDGALVPELQPKLLKAVVFLNNRLPISSLKNFKLLYKALTGNLLELDYTRRVGCRIYKLVLKRKFLKKYDERVYLRVLVSFKGHFVYRLQDPISRKVKRVKEVLFDKDIRLDTATLELPIQLLLIGANDIAPLALEEVIPNTTENYSNVLYYLKVSAIRFEQKKYKRPGNLVLANPFQLIPNYTQTGPIPIQIPQNKLLKDIYYFSI